MGLDVAQEAVLLGPPLSRPGVEEGRVDPTVEFVEVHRVDSVLEAAVLALQARDRLVVECLLVDVALTQRRHDPIENLPGEAEASQQLAETLCQNLLPRVGLRALPLVSRAVVVNVLLLLQLAHHRAAAVAALDQVAVSKLAPNRLWLRPVAPVDNVLNLRPQFFGDDCLVLAGVHLSVEVEVAAVDPIAQDLVDRGGRHGLLALGVLHAVLSGQFGDLLQRVMTGRVPLEHDADK